MEQGVPSLEYLRENRILLYDRTGVYFLFKDKNLVYVGKTTKGIKRIFQHDDKEFDGYYFVDVPPDELSYTEKELILKYKPRYNLSIPGERIKRREVKETKLERIKLCPHNLGDRDDIDLTKYVLANMISNSRQLKELIALQWLEFTSLLASHGVMQNGEIYFRLDYDLMSEELPFLYSSNSKRFPAMVDNLKKRSLLKTFINKNTTYFFIPEEYRILDKKIRRAE